MRHKFKIAMILLGTSVVVVSSGLLAESMQVLSFGYGVSLLAAITGAVWAGWVESKEWERNQKNQENAVNRQGISGRRVEKPINRYPLIEAVKKPMDRLWSKKEHLMADEAFLEEEEKRFVEQTIEGDVYGLCESFRCFPSHVQEEKKQEIIDVFVRMESVLKQMEDIVLVRKERKFLYAKRVLQEKLKRR